jgi:hypothetical protein
MLAQIKKLLQGVFSPAQSYQTDLDRYISSKDPKTVSELEYWMREYDRNQGRMYHGR